MRNLLLFLLILIGVYYLRRLLAGDKASEATRPAEPPALPEAERIVACAHCGLLVPASEGVEARGHFFCSPEHAAQGPSAG